MKNKFQNLFAELDDYCRECENKRSKSNKSYRHLAIAKSNVQSFLNQIKEKRKTWSGKNIHGISLFDGMKFLNDNLKTRYESMWEYLSEYETSPDGEGLIQHTLNKSKEAERVIMAAIINKHKKNEIANLKSNIANKQAMIRTQIIELEKYQKVIERFKQRTEAINDLKKYGKDIGRLAQVGDKAMNWARGKSGWGSASKISLFTASPSSIKQAVDQFANAQLMMITVEVLKVTARRHLGKPYSSMEVLTKEYVDLSENLIKNKKQLEAYKAKLKRKIQ